MHTLIDIDRLHKVADGTLTGRGQGHTLLAVTNLAALLSLQEPVIYCILDTYTDAQYIKDMIISVCEHYELPRIQWIGRLHFICGKTSVFFTFAKGIDPQIFNSINENYPIVVLFEN